MTVRFPSFRRSKIFNLRGPIRAFPSNSNNNTSVTRLTRHEIVRLGALELEALRSIQLNCCCERRQPEGFCLFPTHPPSEAGFAVRDVCEGEPAHASIGEGRGALGSSCQAIIPGGRLWMVLDVPRRPGIPRHPTQKCLCAFSTSTPPQVVEN